MVKFIQFGTKNPYGKKGLNCKNIGQNILKSEINTNQRNRVGVFKNNPLSKATAQEMLIFTPNSKGVLNMIMVQYLGPKRDSKFNLEIYS